MQKFIQKLIELIKRFLGLPVGDPYCRREFNDRYIKKGIVTNWQNREKTWEEGSFKYTLPNKILKKSKKDIVKYTVKQIRTDIRYVSDQENWGKWEYWPRSEEVFTRKKEDCDGQAIAMWRLLENSGKFRSDEIGMAVCHGHMFAVWHHKENDFYILDNGFITRDYTRLASKIFPALRKEKSLVPLFGFNKDKFWRYCKINIEER